MLFPDSPRVIYRVNPLAEVICQLRFPPVLRIESEPPAKFQDRIRREYPLYEEQTGGPSVPVPNGLTDEVIQLIQRALPAGRRGVHQFSSSDRAWTATLARDFVALKTSQYRRWEGFRERLVTLFDALKADYQPAFVTRIGLRYVDVIQRSKLGLENASWSEMLNPNIAGELAASPLVNDIEHVARELRMRSDDAGSRVMIRHGIVQAQNAKEKLFVVDSDFYTEGQTEIDNVTGILDRYHLEAGRLFRRCILPRLHNALDPEQAGT
jgi:uncharacterized protein (TIGR04255 family)